MTQIWHQGYNAAATGLKWWNNPYPSGSVEAMEWDRGHTRWRQTH